MLSSLRVGALTYSVEIDPKAEDQEGWCDPSTCRIGLARLRSRRDWLTLFHEALHALSADQGLGLSEAKVRALEQGVVSLLMDNPALRKGLFPR